LFHYTLREGGVLFLGPSETINGFEDLFTSVDSKWKIFRRRENSMAHTRFIEFPAQMAAIKHLRFTGAEESMSVKGLNRAESLPEKINKLLLQKHTPPSLVVNHKGDVVFIHGRTGKYLEPAPGHFISNAFEMAREGLQLELRGAVLRASTQAGPVILERVNVKTNGHYQLVKLTVEQISKPDELNGLFLVTFEDLPEIKKPSRKKGKEAINPEHNQIIEQLEQELAFTREHLQHTIEQMQSTVEELKSANEELQSTNEELQSTNEESNTAKEEMQALNEELMTVNTQARSKTEELTELNNDITNLLNSSEIYTLFLSNHLHIKRFTPYLTKIIPLVQSDIGRPITNFSSNLKYEHLISDINEVLARLTQKEVEVESANGNWYMLRIVPYRTLDNFIRGVVLSFKEVTPVKQLQKQLAGANEFAADLLNAIKEAALVLNSLFQVIAVNYIFLEYFQLAEEQLIDRNFFNLGNGRWNTEALRQAMEEVLHGKQITEDYQVGRPFGGLGLKPMKLHARRLRRGEDHCILVTLEEIQ
jgi:two-component system CheB/CheR fusion protein